MSPAFLSSAAPGKGEGCKRKGFPYILAEISFRRVSRFCLWVDFSSGTGDGAAVVGFPVSPKEEIAVLSCLTGVIGIDTDSSEKEHAFVKIKD